MKEFHIAKRTAEHLRNMIGKHLVSFRASTHDGTLSMGATAGIFEFEGRNIWFEPRITPFYTKERTEYSNGVPVLSTSPLSLLADPESQYALIPLPSGRILDVGVISAQLDVDNPRIGNLLRWDMGFFLVMEKHTLLLSVSHALFDWRIDQEEMELFEFYNRWSARPDQEITFFHESILSGRRNMIGRYVIRYSEKPKMHFSKGMTMLEMFEEHERVTSLIPTVLVERGQRLSDIAVRARRERLPSED